MLFNSYEFIFAFLPVTVLVFFLLNKRRLTKAAKAWLAFASLVFYGWWNPAYLPLILGSILFNYAIGTILNKFSSKALLIFGVLSNIALLGYFKYVDFFIGNINYLTNSHINLLHIALPLGISFFTFTQIAYLVDLHRSTARAYDFLNYCLFVTFFPHLLAGPIIHHKEMMPQFERVKNKALDYKNISLGLFLFSIGLFKKVIIADFFAIHANRGFNYSQYLTMITAWLTSLSYTFQIYYDFSGYTDMALGSALMFNIRLPINFNSPYKARDIQEFWLRWHITMSRFLKDYLYIPLGGNRNGDIWTYKIILITLFVGGLWHGAGWNFIFWGFLHGIALICHRLWKKMGFSLNNILSWLITFNFVNITWIFFRAKTWDEASAILKAMIGLNGVYFPTSLQAKLKFLAHVGVKFEPTFYQIGADIYFPLVFFISAILLMCNNSIYMTNKFKPNLHYLFFTIICFTIGCLSLNKTSEFIYFRF